MAKVEIRIFEDGRVSRLEAARYVGVSANTLRAWNCTGRNNEFFAKHIVAGRVYYKFDQVKAFVAQSCPA